jgi:hypothetical protein
VVEHSLGKGEVESSILSGSTIASASMRRFDPLARHRRSVAALV